jgi:hypothetical protein
MVRPAHGLPTGTDVSRFLMALHAQTKNQIASDILTRDWRDTPQVAAAFDLRGKASVPVASTQDSVWAGALSEAGIGQTALTLVRTLSIVGAAESRMRRVPFQTNVPRQTGTGLGGGWAPEGTSVAAVS